MDYDELKVGEKVFFKCEIVYISKEGKVTIQGLKEDEEIIITVNQKSLTNNRELWRYKI